MITHTGKKLYQFILLNKHMMSHTDEKPYHCHDCGKDFINNDIFIDNMKIHNCVKPYKCMH